MVRVKALRNVSYLNYNLKAGEDPNTNKPLTYDIPEEVFKAISYDVEKVKEEENITEENKVMKPKDVKKK